MLATLLLGTTLSITADEPGGWPELFPTLGNFGRKVKGPVAAKGEKPTVYSQSTEYDWLGGRFEVLTITLARDAKFKDTYAAEAMKNAKPVPASLEVNKKRAYLWDREKADELDKVNRKLVVVLADDKILMIEQRGAGLELEEVAKKLDLDKVVKALESPPQAAKK
jgi:hypothetical protein